MISSNILPDSGQLEPCYDDLPDNGFSHSETDPDTTSLSPGLKETNQNDFLHVDFEEDSSIPLIADRATAGLLRSTRLNGKPPNKSTVFSYKIIMKCFCVYGIALASLW